MRNLILRIRRYFGLDLPARRLDLNFDLTPPSRRSGKDAVSNGSLTRSLKPLEKQPGAYLRLLQKQIQSQNSQVMAPAKRMARTAVVLRWFYPMAMQCVYRFSKSAGIPDSQERQQLLDMISATTRSLASSYKIVFQGDYDSSRFHYARNRDRIYLCAFRILELIRLEQRSRGLRYQPLPPRAWKDANTLFHVTLTYENVEFPMPLLEGESGERKAASTSNLHDLYAAIQTFALMDYSTWPVEQHAFIDSYRQSIDLSVTVIEDVGGNLGQNVYVSSCYQDRPLLTQRLPGSSDPAVIVNCSILAQNIKKDYMVLMRAKAMNNRFLVPRSLSGLKDAFQIAVSDLMFRNIQRPVWTGDLDQVGIPIRDFRVYVGFKEIYLHLRGVFSNDPRYQDKRKLADALAQRSAQFGEDHTATRESLWHVLHQNKHRILLKTQESSYSIPMGVGSLVAYGTGEDDLRRPRLGSISRIFRPQADMVIIEMDRLASYAEPVKLSKQLAQSQAAPQAMLAFLVCDREIGWGLLLPTQNLVWEGTPVAVQRKKQKLEFEMGRARNLTQKFALFGLPQELTGLGSPGYPSDVQESTSDADEARLPTVLDMPTL